MKYLLIVWVFNYASVTKLLPLSYSDLESCQTALHAFVVGAGSHGVCIPYEGPVR
jgi:hypothetical protein